MKIEECSAKFHYVKTYSKWKLKVCQLIGIVPQSKFYVELIFTVSGGELRLGDFVRFNNHLQARITHHDGRGYVCSFFEENPIHSFQYVFKEVMVIGRPCGEK